MAYFYNLITWGYNGEGIVVFFIIILKLFISQPSVWSINYQRAMGDKVHLRFINAKHREQNQGEYALN